jgi:hypothetical protein
LTSTGVVHPALADVSDGNALPDGAAQFGRIIRARENLAVSKRMFIIMRTHFKRFRQTSCLTLASFMFSTPLLPSCPNVDNLKSRCIWCQRHGLERMG